MQYQFERCREKGKIVEIEVDRELVKKELTEAGYDLKKAEKSLEENDFKWAIVQGYYSMFHSLRALLFSRGYREKSHICLKFAIEALFVDEGLIEKALLDDFALGMQLREGADYGYIYEKESARGMVESAKVMLEKAEGFLAAGD